MGGLCEILTPDEQKELVRWHLESELEILWKNYGPDRLVERLIAISASELFYNTLAQLLKQAAEMLGFEHFDNHWSENPEEWRAVGNLMAALLAEMFGLKEEDYV